MTAAAEHDEVVAAGEHFIQQLNMRDVAHPDADLAIEMDIHDRVTNPRGALQGGLLATLVDVVAGRAVVDDGPRENVATADMTIHYLRGVTVGPALATAKVVRRGRTLAVVSVEVTDLGSASLCAVGTVAFSISERRPTDGGGSSGSPGSPPDDLPARRPVGPPSPRGRRPVRDDLGTPHLRLEREGPIAWCVIDRPSARNAFTPAMYYGLERAVYLVDTDPDLGALVITGVGDVFAPGGDLGGRREEGEATPDALGPDVLPFLAIRDSPAPVIAAVNGICQAGGLLVAMMADVAVASDLATFRVPELLRGIPDATYAAGPARPRRTGRGPRPPALGVDRSTRPKRSGWAFCPAWSPTTSSTTAATDAARQVLRHGAGGPGPGQTHAERALRVDRLPDDVLGAGPLRGTPRGDAGLHGEATAGVGPTRPLTCLRALPTDGPGSARGGRW